MTRGPTRPADADPKLKQVSSAPQARKPDGPVTVWPVSAAGTVLGLLWADSRGAGFLPRPVGSPPVAEATNYAWRILAGDGPPDLAARWAPMYDLGAARHYPDLSAAARDRLSP